MILELMLLPLTRDVMVTLHQQVFIDILFSSQVSGMPAFNMYKDLPCLLIRTGE